MRRNRTDPKHFKRNQPPSRDPITAIVVEVHADRQKRIHADIEWSSAAGVNGRKDALELADRCINEWRKFFQSNNLDPET